MKEIQKVLKHLKGLTLVPDPAQADVQFRIARRIADPEDEARWRYRGTLEAGGHQIEISAPLRVLKRRELGPRLLAQKAVDWMNENHAKLIATRAK